MVKTKEVVELLQQLGLTPYEAQVFFELYKRSPQNATGLARRSKVPRGRIYDVLRSLIKRELIVEKPIAGSPTLYEYPAWHDGLERLLMEREKQIEQEQSVVLASYKELLSILASVSRKVEEEFETMERQQLIPVSGVIAQDYYIKKILDEAKKAVITNFTAELLLKYKSAFLALRKQKVQRTFLLFETELPQVEDIVQGSEIYVLSEQFLNSPLIRAFKDRRPSMIIVDDEVSVLVLLGHTQDALLVKNPELLQYQIFILSLFKQSAQKRVIE
ncbi:MAG: TrmB family transcriptional regulator [Candidatus Odinarchaeota archaeon]